MKNLTMFEETVLLAIYRLNDDAYSVTIHQKILEMTGKDVIVGTLFNALEQLYRKGFLDKQKGTPVQEKGGKSKMFYSISTDGFRALELTREMHEKIWNDIPREFQKEN